MARLTDATACVCEECSAEFIISPMRDDAHLTRPIGLRSWSRLKPLDCPYCRAGCRVLVRSDGRSPLYFCLTHGWFWFDTAGILNESPESPRATSVKRHLTLH